MQYAYPLPEEVAGRPFADPNLKLSILGELIGKGLVDLGDPQELVEHVLGRPVDLEVEGYAMSAPVYDYLARYPLTPEHLDALESIGLDGGNVIYQYAWYFWDGESGEFTVRSLAGIENCANLRVFADCSMLAEGTDISPLRGLSSLERIELDYKTYTNAEVLKELKQLRELVCFVHSIGIASLNELARSGVRVKTRD